MLFIFQITVLIHRTVCSNVQKSMYNLKTKPHFLVGVFLQWRGGVREDDMSVPGMVSYVVNFPALEGWQADSIRPNGKTVASKT